MRFGGLIAAIVLAAIAAVVVLRMSGGQETTVSPDQAGAPQVTSTDIYVAAQPIPIGTTITSEMITRQPWPSHLVLEGFVTADGTQKVEGMVSRSAFQPQEPILLSKLSNINDPNFLAGSLPKGMRVMTIQTNEIEGVAGFVFPGDFVDVILTHDIRKWTTPPGEESSVREEEDPVTETLLTNVKVLAVDQRASGEGRTDEKGNLIIPRSVSLMVSQPDAQRLRLAQQKGTLTLTLRAIADRDSADPLIATTNKDISQFPSEGTVASVDGKGLAEDNVVVVRGTQRGDDKQTPSAKPPLPIGAPGAIPVTPVAQ